MGEFPTIAANETYFDGKGAWRPRLVWCSGVFWLL